MLYVLTINGMIEEDDATAETHHFGLEGSVVSDEYRRTVEYIRRVWDELDSGAEFTEPEVSKLCGTGMGVPYHVPTIRPPFDYSVLEHSVISFESGSKFGYLSPDGSRWFPVKGDGHCSWIVFTPETGMPRVQLWTTDDEGRPVITPGPPSSHFIVRTDESDDVAVLIRELEWAVEWDDSEWEVVVGLTGPVLNVNHWAAEIPLDIAVSGDHEKPVKPWPCYFPNSPIDPSGTGREGVPDRE